MSKRQDILDGARRVFLRHGYHGTRIDAIVAEAKVSRRTLYQHFTTKEDLLVALIETVCAQLIAPLQIPAQAKGPPRAVLKRLAVAYLNVIMAPSALQLYRTVIAEAGRFPELGRAFHKAGQGASVDALASYLTYQSKRGALNLADARFAAEQFLVMVSGAPRTHRLMAVSRAPSPKTLERWAERCVELFLRGCDTPSASRSAASRRRARSP